MRFFYKSGDGVLCAIPFLPFLSGKSEVRFIAFFTLAWVLCKCVVVLFARGNRYKGLFSPVIWLTGFLTIGLFYSSGFSWQLVVQFVQISIVILVILSCPNFIVSPHGLNVARSICFFMLTVSVIDKVFGLNFLFANDNLYALSALCWLMLVVGVYLSHKVDNTLTDFCFLFFVFLLAFFIIKSSGSRAVYVASLVFFMLLVGRRYFESVAAYFIILAPPMLVYWLLVSNLDLIRDYAPSFAGKTTFSGRDVLWQEIVEQVSSDGWRGAGLGASPSMVFDSNYEGLSAHNGFMQILYQTGFLGAMFFTLACFSFVRVVAKRHGGSRGIGVVVFCVGLVHELFEVKLIQNHFGVGLFFWVLSAMLIHDDKEGQVVAIK